MNPCNQRHQCNLWLRTLLHQLMTGEVRTADLRGFGDFADEEGSDECV